MKSIVFACVLVAGCLAEEMTPSQAEATFFNNFASTVPQIVAQQQIQRRMADIFLGLTISSNFQQMAVLEHMKLSDKQVKNVPFFEEHSEANGDNEPFVANDEDEEPKQETSLPRRDAEEEDLEEYENAEYSDISLLEMKEDMTPFMFGGMPMGTSGGKPSRMQLEHQSAAAKTAAVKAMMIQFFLAAGDVEKSHLANKLIMATVPTQMSMWKLFKNYLNTVTLSVAFQFQDAFNTEQLLDDLNDHIPNTAVNAENRAEMQLYSHWYQLVTLKFQLFMFNMYEKMMMGQSPLMNANNNANANNARASFLETESTFASPQDPAAALTQYMYMSYYVTILKYYALFSEYSIAQVGLSTSMMKLSPKKDRNALKMLEFRSLPAAISQWASVNQMRYMLEYYLMMWEAQIPAIGAYQEYNRADNVFQNLVQTGAETTNAPPSTGEAAPSETKN